MLVAGISAFYHDAAAALVRDGEIEVVHVEPDRAVVADVDELLADQACVLRLAVRREPHQLVLA